MIDNLDNRNYPVGVSLMHSRRCTRCC